MGGGVILARLDQLRALWFSWPLGQVPQEDITQVTDAESQLLSASQRFSELANSDSLATPHAYHDVGAAMETLCGALSRAEAAGIPRQRMRELVKEAQAAHSQSPFVLRLQTWPEGYPGDYLTVEHLLSQKNQAIPGTLGYLIEQYCLATRIAQQHRNKMCHQAGVILRTILGSEGRTAPKILVLAAGSSPDIRQILDLVVTRNFRIVLNDSDPEALAAALVGLTPIRDKIVALEGNALRCADEIAEQGPYDLIVAGGLFDYLNANWASQFISRAVNEWLAPRGKFFFTNIAAGNPYRLWMECVTDWEMIERTEQDLVALVTGATSETVQVEVTREATTLTLLASVSRVS
jgi:hypothetical protein